MMCKNRKVRLQSAMEYLMTYGWAILIIAVVLGVLFQLGVFSSSSFAVRAPPGSCQVFKSSASVSLVGQCAGQLPQYVAKFNQLNGKDTYIYVVNSPSINFLNAANSITISAWIYPTSYTGHVENQWYMISKLNYATAGWWFFLTNNGFFEFLSCNGGNCYGPISPNPVPLNQWSHVVGRSNGIASNVFINGVMMSGANSATLLDASGNLFFDLAGGATYDYTYNGMIANIQIYNSSLSESDIQALYVKGIGAVPLNPRYIVGWWPLNGNAKDYSGNGNNGVQIGMSYTDQWLTGYK
jgi:hypothetical protein